jgi:hypothetical protein
LPKINQLTRELVDCVVSTLLEILALKGIIVAGPEVSAVSTLLEILGGTVLRPIYYRPRPFQPFLRSRFL